MNAEDIGKMSVLSLAHVGDAVYELLVRTRLAEKGFSTVVGLHRETVALVKAPAQARAAAVLLPRLTEQEHAVYRRGRNSHVNSVPRGATKADITPPRRWRPFSDISGSQARTSASTSCSKPSWRSNMPLDAVCLTALLRELAPELEGARIDKVQQPRGISCC